MKMPKWVYFIGVVFLLIVYYIGEATDLLVLAMFIILPLGWWVISNIFDPNS